jgi:hypothetical protein
MARASAVIGLTMLGAAGAGAATIPLMGSPSVSGLRCDAHRFPTAQACEAAGHTVCRPDGIMFVPANCSTGSGTSGTRWYNTHPIYWFGSGSGRTTTTTSPTHSGPSSVTTTSRGGSGGTTTTGGGTSARGGFGSSGTGHGSGSS